MRPRWISIIAHPWWPGVSTVSARCSQSGTAGPRHGAYTQRGCHLQRDVNTPGRWRRCKRSGRYNRMFFHLESADYNRLTIMIPYVCEYPKKAGQSKNISSKRRIPSPETAVSVFVSFFKFVSLAFILSTLTFWVKVECECRTQSETCWKS